MVLWGDVVFHATIRREPPLFGGVPSILVREAPPRIYGGDGSCDPVRRCRPCFALRWSCEGDDDDARRTS